VKRFPMMLAAVVGLSLSAEGVVSAGVVMSEVAIANGPVGNGT